MLGTVPALILAGDRLPWFIVGMIVLGLVIAWLLAGNVRRSTTRLPPPVTHARLLPDDEDEQDGEAHPYPDGHSDGPARNDHRAPSGENDHGM